MVKQDPTASADYGCNDSSFGDNAPLRLGFGVYVCFGTVLLCALVTAHLSRSLLGNIESPPTLSVFPPASYTMTASAMTEPMKITSPKASATRRPAAFDNKTIEDEDSYYQKLGDAAGGFGDRGWTYTRERRRSIAVTTDAAFIHDHVRKVVVGDISYSRVRQS